MMFEESKGFSSQLGSGWFLNCWNWSPVKQSGSIL